MSHALNDELWLITKNDLEKLLTLDKELQEKSLLKDSEVILNIILPLYLRYKNIVKKLIVCHDQLIQTDKRNLIKRLLDCAIGRMLEYKQEVVKLDFYDYQWPDDLMNRMKITPDDVDIPAPICKRENITRRYNDHVKESSAAVQHGKSLVIRINTNDINVSTSSSRTQSLPLKMNDLTSSRPSQDMIQHKPVQEIRISTQEIMHNAILLIQSHERARTARCLASLMKKQFLRAKEAKSSVAINRKCEGIQLRNAVIVIQSAWRRYAARLALRRRINRTEDMLEMTMQSWQSRPAFEEEKKIAEKRHEMIANFAKRTEEVVSAKRTNIGGPGLIEDIADEIREWFILWYNSIGSFDLYPTSRVGGSVAIVTGQTLTPQEFLAQSLSQQKTERTNDKTKFKEPTEAESQKGKIKKTDREWKMPKTNNYDCLSSNNKDLENWTFAHQTSNHSPKKCLDPITEKLCYELQLQTREIVDEMMRLELKRLQQARQKDRQNTSVVGVTRNGAKTKKPGRKKEQTVMTSNRSKMQANVPVKEWFDKLIDEGIIRNYPTTSLSDWQGDMSYQNHEAGREFREYRYRIGEVKQILREYCVLPLSSKETHKVAPLIKSLCICGLPRSGKSFLVNAICAEVGALLFDMSPNVLEGKYLGRTNERMLMNMINNVSRAYSPSIVFIDGSEKLWIKKVPVEERHMRPKRFAPYLLKFVKGIKPGDQVLFLTTSTEPYKARRPFLRIHDKFLIIPRTDYNTLFMYYKNELMRYYGVSRDLDISCLAKISVGVPLEFVRQALEKVLSLKRRITLKSKPLTQSEIMQEIMMYQAPDKKILDKFNKFEDSTPLGKNRLKHLAYREAQLEKSRMDK